MNKIIADQIENTLLDNKISVILAVKMEKIEVGRCLIFFHCLSQKKPLFFKGI